MMMSRRISKKRPRPSTEFPSQLKILGHTHMHHDLTIQLGYTWSILIKTVQFEDLFHDLLEIVVKANRGEEHLCSNLLTEYRNKRKPATNNEKIKEETDDFDLEEVDDYEDVVRALERTTDPDADELSF